eukprot:TRINITY_DN2110_c0_g1_i1.p1 TRINITY_DN2110_c0_g1~~TRINITY_DN2110_c0_g1_i1.p1  ORF type:complete len:105 (+),score=16.46 TRINITY_DN2110_c0_g1_i1:55-369(+)
MCIRDSFWSENATRERVYVVQLERSYTEVCAAALFALRLLDARRQRRLVLHAGTQRAARLGAARHLPVGRIKVFFLPVRCAVSRRARVACAAPTKCDDSAPLTS